MLTGQSPPVLQICKSSSHAGSYVGIYLSCFRKEATGMSDVLRLLGVVLAPVLAVMTLFWIGPITGVGIAAGTLLLVGLLTGVLIRSWWSTAYIVALGLVWIFYTILVYTGSNEITLP
ncbi:MAG TPA: TQO small subunit DoxD, partial [Nitrolancea sp.]|nr:TQO small subunit DoxD [Nitrolancea sp.]